VYIHIGDGTYIRAQDVVGIFDLENTTTMRATAEFLHISQEEAFTVNAVKRGEMPKSFILADINGMSRVYISPVTSQTLYSRLSAADRKYFRRNR